MPKIEKGKFYKTRSGLKAECINIIYNDTAVIKLENGMGYLLFASSGRVDYERDYPQDIVSEWKGPDNTVKVKSISQPVPGRYGVVNILQAGTSMGVFEIRGNRGAHQPLVNAKDLRDAIKTLTEIAEIWESNEE